MNKKKILIFSILWTILAVVVLLAYFFPHLDNTDGITADKAYTESEDAVYVGWNSADTAVIYKLDKNGNKKGLFIGSSYDALKDYSICKITYDQTLHAVFSCDALYEGKDVTAYRLVSFGENMVVVGMSDMIILGGDIDITYLSTDDNDIYVSATNKSKTEGYAYRISKDVIKDVESGKSTGLKGTFKNSSKKTKTDNEIKSGEASEVSPFVFEVADAGRCYAGWAYEPGELHTRYDNEKMDSFFGIPGSVDIAYKNLIVTSYDKHLIHGFHFGIVIIIWALGIPFIIVITVLLSGKNKVVYIGVVLEVVLFLVMLFEALSMVKNNSELSRKEHEEYTSYIMEKAFSGLDLEDLNLDFTDAGSKREDMLSDFYESDTYVSIYEELADYKSISGDGWEIYGMAVIDRDMGDVIVSDNRLNRVYVNYLYGRDIASFSIVSNIGNNIRSKRFNIDGETYVVFARSLDGAGMKGCSLIGVVRFLAVYKSVITRYNRQFKTMALGFIIASILILLVLILENRDIHAVAKMLKNLAEGKSDIGNPTVRGKDVVSIKNSAFEIDKNIASINRSKYKIFEAYYRFAPKSIENILKKNSITEVDIGDLADVKGTVAILSTKERKRLNDDELAYMNRYFEIVERYREEYKGIYVTNNETLSRTRLLFPEKNKKAVSFGIDVINSMREWKKKDYTDTMILLHYTTFSYGICGTKTQSMPLIASTEIEKLSDVAEWFRTMRLSMVVTGDVLENESGFGDVRYLGFVRADGGKRIDLYEIIGAEGRRMSGAKKKTRDAFEAALRMFYDKDFYLARNAFTEILREMPYDEISKWYLFECETQLNGNQENTFTGELHL